MVFSWRASQRATGVPMNEAGTRYGAMVVLVLGRTRRDDRREAVRRRGLGRRAMLFGSAVDLLAMGARVVRHHQVVQSVGECADDTPNGAKLHQIARQR